MKIKKHWTFPVASTQQYNDAQLIHNGADLCLLFDYYDETKNNGNIFKSGIVFEMAIAHSHFAEGYKLIDDSYDTLIEILDSKWVKELSKSSAYQQTKHLFNLRHFAIYLDSNAQYEVIAHNFKIKDIEKGKLEINDY